MIDVASRTLMISGRLFGRTDEQNMQIFLKEFKICQYKGNKMEAIIIENRSITIRQNCSIHSMSNLTKPFTEFNIILADIIISNNQCEGMVLDATLNHNKVKILLLCYENGRIIERNNSEKDKNDFIRYHFISNGIAQRKKVKQKNERFWEKAVIVLILIITFICILIALMTAVQTLCKKKKSISNIHDKQVLLTSSINRKSNLLITNTPNHPYYYDKSYHTKSLQTYHPISYFD
ncbi:Pro-neuregulin-2, membrane-bound isoform [Dirofilaria immitis]